MLRKSHYHWCYNAAFMAAIMTSPLVCAAAPLTDPAGANMISNLLRTASPLSTRELGTIRGGFDLSPRLTINFAFQQIESSGNRIIQSIEVPAVTLTTGTPNITPIVTSNVDAGTTEVTGRGGITIPATGGTNTTGTQNAIPNAESPTTTIVPADASKITLTSSANGGATIVQSQLEAGGITDVISNTANNALVSQMTTMNIAISGMQSWISSQRSSFNSGGGAFGSLSVYR
jgi:hypothetical protein